VWEGITNEGRPNNDSCEKEVQRVTCAKSGVCDKVESRFGNFECSRAEKGNFLHSGVFRARFLKHFYPKTNHIRDYEFHTPRVPPLLSETREGGGEKRGDLLHFVAVGERTGELIAKAHRSGGSERSLEEKGREKDKLWALRVMRSLTSLTGPPLGGCM
jgi:hypothetical protein